MTEKFVLDRKDHTDKHDWKCMTTTNINGWILLDGNRLTTWWLKELDNFDKRNWQGVRTLRYIYNAKIGVYNAKNGFLIL